jgi:hypothetical protein
MLYHQAFQMTPAQSANALALTEKYINHVGGKVEDVLKQPSLCNSPM